MLTMTKKSLNYLLLTRVLIGFTVVGCASSASAASLIDTYWGGGNTYNGSPGTAYPNLSGDVIGDSTYEVTSATVQRTAGTLQVTINTNYAGMAGTDGLTGYGSLFFSTNLFTPTGTGPQYATDVYTPGRFNFVFAMPENPGAGNQSGAGGLFQVVNSDVVMSNVNGTTVTYPTNPNSGYYFRQDQAVQYNPDGQVAVASGSWVVDELAHTIVFSILDNGLLGNDFMLYWTETCANDVLLGEVAILPTTPVDPLVMPLPGTLPLFATGLGALGLLGWRRKRKAQGV